MTILCLIFPETTTLCFPQHLLHLTIPPTAHNSSFSAFSPHLSFWGLFLFIYSKFYFYYLVAMSTLSSCSVQA